MKNTNEPPGIRDIINNENKFLFLRVLGIKREDVFNAFTDPALLIRWWGPLGSVCPECMVDARPGGIIQIKTVYQNQQYVMKGMIHELEIPAHLSFTASYFRDDEIPDSEIFYQIMLDEHMRRTKITIEGRFLKQNSSKNNSDFIDKEWNQKLDKISDILLKRKYEQDIRPSAAPH